MGCHLHEILQLVVVKHDWLFVGESRVNGTYNKVYQLVSRFTSIPPSYVCSSSVRLIYKFFDLVILETSITNSNKKLR